VVLEAARSQCIWHQAGAADGIGERWWQYTTNVIKHCVEDSKDFAASTCKYDAMRSAGVDVSKVEDCLSAGGGFERDGRSQMMDNEVILQTNLGAMFLPAMYVNGAVVRGTATAENLFNAICSAYMEGTQPAICRQCSGCADVVACVEHGGCSVFLGNAKSRDYFQQYNREAGTVSTGTCAGTIVTVVILMSALFMIQRRRAQNQMSQQVRGILAEYVPLDHNGVPVRTGGASNGMFGNGGESPLSTQLLSMEEPMSRDGRFVGEDHLHYRI
jgi:hypothetical protein